MRSRILIVDDHDGFRAIARAMLESEDFDVVGEAVDGGAEILAQMPGPPVVVLISSRPIADLRRRVRDCPVAGFLAKHELSGAAVTALVG